MANDLNQCNFIGRLGSDPETRFMTSGKPVCNFNIAVGESWKDQGGAKQESTTWVPVVIYGNLAEICQSYLVKGSLVFISGKFKTRKWTDKDGKDRYTTEIIGDRMQMLGGKDTGKQDAPPMIDEGDIPF